MSAQFNLPMFLAQVAPATAEIVDSGDEMSMMIQLIIAVAVIAGSFLAGAAIARALRMPDFGFRIGLVLFTLVGSVAVCIAGWPPKRGIDLSGGVVLVYEVDKGSPTPALLQNTVEEINQQLDAGGDKKLVAKPAGANQIEIEVPAGVEVAEAEKRVAALEARLKSVGTRKVGDQTVLLYSVDPQEKKVEMDKLITAVGKRINPSGVKELTIRRYGAEQIEVIIPEVEEREVDQIKRKISTSGLLEFRIVADRNQDRDEAKAAERTPGRDVYLGDRLVGRWVKAGKELRVDGAVMRDKGKGPEILVRIDPFGVDGGNLRRASQGFDDAGSLAVNFSFDNEGAQKFGELTGRNLPDTAIGFYRKLGIILDDELLSAPRINSMIRGDGQITGQFTQEEINFLVGVLNAGSLPASLRPEPISQQRISSQLGRDTIERGTLAIVISTAAILVFMVVYYRFCGFVADVAVLLNLLVTVALMILIKAAFTLPGLAGMVLTVGMAVDANVLIYERMREETARGASLRMAIRNGFSRAMSTIIDSHVTTLASAVVLYVVGTDQIKGFAVTLIIGLLMSLFTAVYVARVIMDVAEKQRWITKLNMMHFIGETNLDFIRWRGAAIAFSLVIVAAGVVATAMRGKEILDIDFTGGTSVQLAFAADKPHGIAEVREAVAELPDVAVSAVGENDLDFKIDTSERDIKQVQTFLQEKFGDSLRTYQMAFADATTIDAPKSEETAAETKPESKTETRPATEPPAESPLSEPKTETPAAEKPAAETPATEKPAEAPAGDKTSLRNRRPRSVTVAAIGEVSALSALLTAQETAPPVAEPEQPAPPADEKPAAPASDPPAAEAPAATEPVGEKPTADKPASESDTKPAAPAETTPASGLLPTKVDSAGPVDESVFVGGTRVKLTFPQDISYAPLREMVQQELDAMQVKEALFEISNPDYQFGSDARYTDWMLETTLNREQTETLLKNIQAQLAKTPVFPSSGQIGGKVAGDTQLTALYALLASMLIIVLYVWVRFQNVIYGLAAVVALVHDVIITVAAIALSYYLSPYLGFLQVDPFKINLAVVAALLTIIGFSINDTIVIFDRIREVKAKSPTLTAAIVNNSINQTLSRTILTSGTVFIACIILYFVGGPGIHGFAFAMLIGVIAGTYSTVYIAAPILLWLQKSAAPETYGKRAGSTATSTLAKNS